MHMNAKILIKILVTPIQKCIKKIIPCNTMNDQVELAQECKDMSTYANQIIQYTTLTEWKIKITDAKKIFDKI